MSIHHECDNCGNIYRDGKGWDGCCSERCSWAMELRDQDREQHQQALEAASADTVARIVARLRKTLPLQYGYVIEDIEREFKK